MTEQINQNSVAGSHEMRGEVTFKQRDSTRNLIQFFVVLSIKTWNCFQEFTSPVAQATLVTNYCQITFWKSRWLIQFQIQSDVLCSFFSVTLVNRLSSSREIQYQFSNAWQNHIWKQNQESIAAIILTNILFLFGACEIR